MLPRVPLAACLERWAAEQTIEDYHSAAAGHRTRATRRTRLASFPPFLLVQLQRCAPLCALSPPELPAARLHARGGRHADAGGCRRSLGAHAWGSRRVPALLAGAALTGGAH